MFVLITRATFSRRITQPLGCPSGEKSLICEKIWCITGCMVIGYIQPNDISSASLIVYYLYFYRMLEVPHQNGFHPASCSSPLPSSHTPSPGLSNGSPGSNPAEVKNKSDFRPANLKVVIPNSGPPQSHQQSGSLETGGLLGISRGHDDVSIFLLHFFPPYNFTRYFK